MPHAPPPTPLPHDDTRRGVFFAIALLIGVGYVGLDIFAAMKGRRQMLNPHFSLFLLFSWFMAKAAYRRRPGKSNRYVLATTLLTAFAGTLFLGMIREWRMTFGNALVPALMNTGLIAAFALLASLAATAAQYALNGLPSDFVTAPPPADQKTTS